MENTKDQNLISTDETCLYGFKRKYFLSVLFQKAKSIHPTDTDETIWNKKVPNLLDQLYEDMDKKDFTVCNIIGLLYDYFLHII